MRWNAHSFRFAFCLFAVFALLLALPASPLLAEKENPGDHLLQGNRHMIFNNRNLSGTYVAQATGTTNFPSPPLSDLNGPYAITGRLVADGRGNISGSAVQIRNGMRMTMPFTGTYDVAEDGTFSLTVTGETPLGPLSIEHYGVLIDGGEQAKLPGKRVAVLAENLYEDWELWYPLLRLQEEGAEVKVVAPKSGETYMSKHGYPVKSDASAESVDSSPVFFCLPVAPRPAPQRRWGCGIGERRGLPFQR